MDSKNTQDLVWYLSYGSNMLYERFMHYIKGGSFRNGAACHEPCSDQTPPRRKTTYDIPYDMYFGGHFKYWDGLGVSFLDTSWKGQALGVAYLVTRHQFEHVTVQENGGRPPAEGLYSKILSLGTLDGYEVVTFTHDGIMEYTEPCENYLDTLTKGLLENYEDMTEEEIRTYLTNCIRK